MTSENEGVRRYEPDGPRASGRNMGRLHAARDLFRARGVAGEFKVWFAEQQRRPDDGGGLSGDELVAGRKLSLPPSAGVRSAHPELTGETYRVIRS